VRGADRELPAMAMTLVMTLPSAFLLPTSASASLRVSTPRMVTNAEDAAKAAWLARLDAPTWGAGSVVPSTPIVTAPIVPAQDAEEAAKAAWLASLGTEPSWLQSREPISFLAQPLSYFALDLLAPKGTRRSQGGAVDVGEPEDFSRPFAKSSWNGARVGSWACTEGGWESPKLRPTTETFLVLDGLGAVADEDGVIHSFRAGDVVVLPKHWHGRWDIYEQIHKVWVVHDHPDVPGAADGIVRAVVAPTPSFACAPVVELPLRAAPANVAQTIYDVGPTRVGFLAFSPGSFEIAPRLATEVFFVVDGVYFLTNVDGSSRRCVAGDSVVLPAGWTGFWDVVEPGRQVWVEVE